MGKFIKNHRYTLILVLIFALIVLLGVKLKSILVPDEGKATYGERLKDIEKYPIDKEVYDSIDAAFAENNNVTKITHRLRGKTIVYSITFKDEVSVANAKTEAAKLLTFFDEETLGYYSIEVYLIKDNEALNNFPIIGMKNPLSKTFSFTKDREITKSDENEE